jgi:hypothetical protein
MQRAVDTSDFLNLREAKRLIDEAFKGGTAWYQYEQADLQEASSALARVIADLRKETPVRAVARRLASQTGGTATPAPEGFDAPVPRRRRPRTPAGTDSRDDDAQRGFSPTSAAYFEGDRVRTTGRINELGLGPRTEGRVLLTVDGMPGYGSRQLVVLFKGRGRPMMVSVDEVEIAEGT